MCETDHSVRSLCEHREHRLWVQLTASDESVFNTPVLNCSFFCLPVSRERKGVGGGQTERHRERKRQTDRQRQRDRYIQRKRQTETERDRQTETEQLTWYLRAVNQCGIISARDTDTQTENRQTDTETDRQTDRDRLGERLQTGRGRHYKIIL